MPEEIKIDAQDPMALAENHFEKQEVDAEEAFLEQYQTPVAPSQGISEQREEEDLNEDPNEDQNEDPVEPLKFDDAIANSEKEELEELNAKLGTNYTDLKDLKNALKKDDHVEQNNEIEQERVFINYFKEVLNPKIYNDRRVVFEDKKMALQQEGKDITDPEIIEEINADIDGMEENKVLSYAANSIRGTVRQALAQKEAKVNEFDAQKQATQQQTETQRKEGIQDAINDIYSAGNFMGVKPTKEDMIDVYKEVNKNKDLQHVSSNPKEVVEFVLFKKYRNILDKNLNKGSYKDGVKNTLEKIGLSGSQQTVKQSQETQGNSEEEKSYFEKFIQ